MTSRVITDGKKKKKSDIWSTNVSGKSAVIAYAGVNFMFSFLMKNLGN